MRTFVAVLLLGSLATAYPYHGHRNHRGHYSHHGFRYHAKYVGCSSGFKYHPKYVHHRYHRGYYRVYRPTHRVHYRYRRYYYPRYHGDSYYGCDGYYGHRYYHGYRPYLSFSPIYTRMTTVLTIDDPEFDGPAAAPKDNDGLPRPRTKPVGSRFLVDLN